MDQSPVLASDRRFQIWFYTVSHRELHLRSNKGDAYPEAPYPTRLEVLFKGVEFMAVYPSMRGLTITESSTDELPAALNPPKTSGRWYRLQSANSVGYVAALAAYVGEDDLEYGDPDFWEMQYRTKAAEMNWPVSDLPIGIGLRDFLAKIRREGSGDSGGDE